jgi:hypothetical protein
VNQLRRSSRAETASKEPYGDDRAINGRLFTTGRWKNSRGIKKARSRSRPTSDEYLLQALTPSRTQLSNSRLKIRMGGSRRGY